MGGAYNNGKYYGVGSPNGLYAPGSGPGELFKGPGDPNAVTDPFKSLLTQAPTKTPDLTDAIIQGARKSQAASLLTARGRASSFMQDLNGQPAPPLATGSKSLLGG